MPESDIPAPTTRVVPLLAPITPFEGKPPITAVTLKEPTGGHYRRLGEPRLLVSTGQGGLYYVEQPAIISAYLDAVVDHEQGSVLIDQLGLADAMRVKLELFSFFTAAEARASSTTSTSSSSA